MRRFLGAHIVDGPAKYNLNVRTRNLENHHTYNTS